MTPGQLPTLALALVGALADVLTAYGAFGFTDSEKTAVLAVASAAIALGVGLYSFFSHQMAMTGRK